ncbi:MAG: DNA-directed polymerase subunit [Candidatus Nitrosotenuis sp.]|nr:DNA-directed polymerase subunit [Candidatus Nitrosotenuis sp.]
MSDPEEVEVEVTEEVEEEPEFTRPAGTEEIAEDTSMEDAVAAYKKIFETKELTDDERVELDKKVKEMERREIVDMDPIHEIVEIPLAGKGKMVIGPPTLTRFEKARILGARALQLSLGAPPFITIPANARTSLDIALKELEDRVIPIVIKRRLPNGDYQNIPIDFFN